MSDQEVLDAEAVEEEEAATEPQEGKSETEMVEVGNPQGEKAMIAVPGQHGVIAPLDPATVIQSFEAYQQLLPRLLKDSDWQDAGRGKRFVKKSGWRKIAKAFGLSTEIVSQKIERDGDGQPLRATVIVRALHGPTGQHSDGDGHCSVDEERFSGARGNKSKLENDLTATATTRAKNRAISDLVGMGDVSAEEMAGGALYGPEANAEQKKAASDAFRELLGPNAEGVWGAIKSACGGYMPEVVAESVSLIVSEREKMEGSE